MKMKAIANYIKKQPGIKKVYLLNQDCATASSGRTMAGRWWAWHAPDVQFVGETLHPIGRVKGFAPYLAKIRRAARADPSSPATGARTWCCCSRRRATRATTCATSTTAQARSWHGAGGVAGQAGVADLVAEWHPGRPKHPTVDALAKAQYKAKTGKGISWRRASR